jgi:hypothetical protein
MGCSPSNSKSTKQTTQPMVATQKANNDQTLKSIAFEIPADDLKSGSQQDLKPPVLPDGGSRWKVCRYS